MKPYLLYVLTVTTFCTGKVFQLPKVDRHYSPLDGPEGSGDVAEPALWMPGEKFVAEPPSCKSVCVTKVLRVLKVYFRSGSFTENMHRACRAYDNATTCMSHHRHCGGDSMFKSLTSGLRYMCVDQKDAFNALAGCIDENSARVKQDCDQQCHPNSLATGIALKNTVMNQLEHPLVSKNVNMRRIIEPHMSRFFFSQGCRIAQCLMACTRTKYNMMCEGTAGSLLLEMLTLPLSAEEANSAFLPSTTHLASFLGGLLPHTCSFLTAGEGERGSFRIDPALDKEIKRMYSDKNRSSSVVLPNSLSQPVEIENPFMKMSSAFHRASPFDNPEAEEQLLENGALPRDENQFEESSGSTDASLHRTVIDDQSTTVSTGESSSINARRDILLTTSQSGLLPEHRVEAGTEYRIHLPEHLTDMTSTQALQEESLYASYEEDPPETEEWSGEPDYLGVDS